MDDYVIDYWSNDYGNWRTYDPGVIGQTERWAIDESVVRFPHTEFVIRRRHEPMGGRNESDGKQWKIAYRTRDGRWGTWPDGSSTFRSQLRAKGGLIQFMERPGTYDVVYIASTDEDLRNPDHPQPTFLSRELRGALKRYAVAGDPVATALVNYETHNADVDYLDMDTNGALSFLPRSKADGIQFDGTGRWLPVGRQSGKAGRVIGKAILPSVRAELTDAQIEAFTNRIKADTALADGGIHLVTGAEIARWYDGNQYASGVKSLSVSCMRYDYCQPYFALYVNNPDRIQMAVTVNEYGLLTGRALVWKTDNGFTFMDRIYSTDAGRETFKTYAREHGWWHREYQSYERPYALIDPDGKKRTKAMVFSLGATKPFGQGYPYLDTFKFYDTKEKVLHNHDLMRHHLVLMHTHGNYHDSHSSKQRSTLIPTVDLAEKIDTIPMRSCGNCGGNYPDNDIRRMEGGTYCPTCYEATFEDCSQCHTAVWRDQTHTLDGARICDRCFREQGYMYCKGCNTIHKRNTMKEMGGSYWLCAPCEKIYLCSKCGRYNGRKTTKGLCTSCQKPTNGTSASLYDSMTTSSSSGTSGSYPFPTYTWETYTSGLFENPFTQTTPPPADPPPQPPDDPPVESELQQARRRLDELNTHQIIAEAAYRTLGGDVRGEAASQARTIVAVQQGLVSSLIRQEANRALTEEINRRTEQAAAHTATAEQRYPYLDVDPGPMPDERPYIRHHRPQRFSDPPRLSDPPSNPIQERDDPPPPFPGPPGIIRQRTMRDAMTGRQITRPRVPVPPPNPVSGGEEDHLIYRADFTIPDWMTSDVQVELMPDDEE